MSREGNTSNLNLKSLPGQEDIRREVLPGGITVLARSNFNSPSVSIGGYLQTGSLFDPDEKLGLADFATSALTRGTSKHTFDALYNVLESAGASLGFDSGSHTTGFGGRALAGELPLSMALHSEVRREPTVPSGQGKNAR